MNSRSCVSIICRRVGLNRLDDLLALETACFTTDRSTRRNLRHVLQSPSAHCVGAYCSGALAGSMVVFFRSNSCVARLASLAVLPEFQRRGIGRRLVENAEREARRRGCNRMTLEVRMDNIPAIRLYERLGFEDIAVKPGYYEDGAHAFVMRKDFAFRLPERDSFDKPPAQII